MAFPYDSGTNTAITNLSSYYNNNNYNVSTNPGGFRLGGHIVNFIAALGAVATVAVSMADAANAASASATAAAASAVTAAASASQLAGTSVTSLAIATTSKTFVTQTGKFFDVGNFVIAKSAANPATNWMAGQVTAYSAGNLTILVTNSGGSGTYADWILAVTAQPGQTGSTGSTGSVGPSPAIQLNFSTGTSDSDPGNGIFRLNSSTTSAVNFIYFDNLNKDSVDIQNWLDALDDSTNSSDRGRLYMVQPSDATKFAVFKITGAVTDGSGYRKVPVSYVISSSPSSVPFTNADPIAINFSPTGNAGLNGSGAGDVVGPSSAIDGGIALFDGVTGKLIKDSAKGIGTSGANVGLLNGNNTYSGTSSFTGTFAHSSTHIGTIANANAFAVGPNGSTNPTFQVDTSTASAATGVKVKSAAAAAGVTISVISSGTDENLTFDAKGAGTITFGATSTGNITFSRATFVPTASVGTNTTQAASTAFVVSMVRSRLTGNVTYYVRTGGSNSNTGTANTDGGAWLTLQYAWDTLIAALDLNGYTLTIQVADGTYTAGIGSFQGFVGAKSSNSVVVQGNNGTPANVLISVTSNHCFNFGYAAGVELGGQTMVRIRDLKMSTTTSGDCIAAMGGGCYIQFDNVNFGSCAGNHITGSCNAYIYESGAVSGPGSSGYAVSGNAAAHVLSAEGAQVTLHGATITYSNSPVFSQANFWSLWGGRIFANAMTFTNGGTVTGKRFRADDPGSLVYTGGSLTYVPGDVAGTCSKGGIYDGTEVLHSAGYTIDRAYDEYTTNADLTTVIPADDTIPQSTEGTQILSASITPKATTSRLRCRFQGWGAVASGSQLFSAAMFTGGASAVAASFTFPNAAEYSYPIALEYEFVPGVTSSVTVTIRVGPNNAGALRMNGNPSVGRYFGGASRCTLVLEELAA